MSDAMNEAWVEVLPDFSRFAKEADRGIVDHLGAAGDRGSRRMGNSLVAGIGKFALPIAGAIAALGIGNLIGDAVKVGIDQVSQSVVIGSDLAESVNALNKSFGDASEGVQQLGRESATSLGISNREFNSLAVRFSGFADAIVGEGGDAARFIDELTTRGSDFASVYNLEVAEALELFQSGLAGETEPLRRFGVDLSAAAVESFAYANGIGTVGTALTEAQKQQARYGLLLQETAKTEGDFADTSGELANQQRILAASFEDAQAKLGTALLPSLTELINLANEELVPILDEVIDEVGPILADAIAQSVPLVKDLVTAFAPLIPDLARLAAEALPRFVDLMITLAPLLIDVVASTASFFEQVSNIIDLLSGEKSFEEYAATVDGLSGSLGELIKWVTDTATGFAMFRNQVAVAFGGFVRDTRNSIGEVVGFIASLPSRALEAVGNIGATLRNAGRALIQGFIDGVRSMLSAVGNTFGGLMDFVRGFFPNSPAERGPFSGSGWTQLLNSGGAIMDAFESGLRPVEVPLTTHLPSIPDIYADRSVGGGSAPTGGTGDGGVMRLAREDLDYIGEVFARAMRRDKWSGGDA